jgi:hypothetical protein
MKNFHLPLPEPTYTLLRAEAERTQVPATTLAREAIDSWLRVQARKARHEAIATYAAEMAGTDLDLDRDLESAGSNIWSRKAASASEARRRLLGGSCAQIRLRAVRPAPRYRHVT